jgi:hypothetical protein
MKKLQLILTRLMERYRLKILYLFSKLGLMMITEILQELIIPILKVKETKYENAISQHLGEK